MSYTPTEWKDGDIITAEKLNKIENGVAEGGSGGNIVLHFPDPGTAEPDDTIESGGHTYVFYAEINGVTIQDVMAAFEDGRRTVLALTLEEDGQYYFGYSAAMTYTSTGGLADSDYPGSIEFDDYSPLGEGASVLVHTNGVLYLCGTDAEVGPSPLPIGDEIDKGG